MTLLKSPQRMQSRSVGRAIALASALAACMIAGRADTPVPPVAGSPLEIDAAGLKHQIESRAGKVVVVNFWATWCDPCKAEFPDLARFAKANKVKGVELVTVSFDDAASISKSVVPFLAKSHITTGTFVNKSGAHLDDAYITYLEPKLPADDAFGLPRTYIFDRKGKLEKVLVGGQTYTDFEKATKPFLGR